MEKKILIVDDEVIFLSGLSKVLQRYCNIRGEIKAVVNGSNALEAINSGPFDICFLDINLPDISGLDIMKRINEVSPETKIAIMSGSYLTEDMKTEIENGSSIFFNKPVEIGEIINFIKNVDGDIESDEDLAANKGLAENAAEKRAYERKPFRKTVRYSLNVFGALNVFSNGELKFDLISDTLDISDGGLGILTDHLLKAGQILKFDEALENRTGIVKWSGKADDYCRAGIKFL